LHLTGHAAVQDDGDSVFLFEDERGHRDPVSGRELAFDALAESNVQCVFVSGCQTGQAPDVDAVGGICQGLVDANIPNAVGWAASIGDEVAISFAERFYKVLAAGSPVDQALIQARREIRSFWEDRGDPSWTLPVLYSASMQTDLFDPAKEQRPPPVQTNRNPLPGMPEGHADHLVGRRREIQRFLPDLRDGDLRVLLLAGLGGVGKSTLATRLARSLEDEGFRPIAVSGATNVQEIINECREVFRAVGLNGANERLGNEDRKPWDRLCDLIRVLNNHSFVLVLDDYEALMDPDDRETKNKLVRQFVERLSTHLTEASRCIITSRYLLDELDDNQTGVRSKTLEELPQSAFFKFLLADEEIERRIENRDLSYDLLGNIHDLFGGTPRFLEQVREVLRQEDADALEADLETVTLPDTDDENVLREARDKYLEDLFASRLYQSLPESSRYALSRAAVYTIPMTVEGYAAAADVEESTMEAYVRQWQDRAFVYPESNEETKVQRWSVYRLLRRWLLRKTDKNGRRAAHEAAGDFLLDVYEEEREDEDLGMHFLDVELEARSRFLDGKESERAREITDRLSGLFTRRGLYDDVVRLNEEVLEDEKHAVPMLWLGRSFLELEELEEADKWYRRAGDMVDDGNRSRKAEIIHGLASIDGEKGDVDKALEKFGNVVKIRQDIEDYSGEASTRHNIATILADKEKNKRAQEEYGKALKIHQEVENRDGEGLTFAQMGFMAIGKIGKKKKGLRLLCLSYYILDSVHNSEAKAIGIHIGNIADDLGYSEEDLEEDIEYAYQSYEKDRGWKLIREAFPDANLPDDMPPQDYS
jgi:tetratricopeptide (TPR) repeat protein